jgi:hypothetical protein
MRNEQIDGSIINHSPTPLRKKEQMWALEAKEMESSSKIDLKDVSWWMSIKHVYKPRMQVIVKLSKEGCISLAIGGRLSQAAQRHN